LDRRVHNAVATDGHLAFARRDEASDHAHGRAFARCVRPDVSDRFAFLDGEGHAVNRDLRAKRLLQVSNFDHEMGWKTRAGFRCGCGMTSEQAKTFEKNLAGA